MELNFYDSLLRVTFCPELIRGIFYFNLFQKPIMRAVMLAAGRGIRLDGVHPPKILLEIRR